MKNSDSILKWIAEHLSKWRIDIGGYGELEWLDDEGWPVIEKVKYPENYDRPIEEDEIFLFKKAVEQAMEKCRK